MATTVGFVLLSHNNPAQLRRLCDRLRAMFAGAPIVCHHDFSQCPLEPADAPGVSFVRPHVETGWGDFSLVEATIRALRVMHARVDAPEWVFLLSASDYPIRPAEEILGVLADASYDAYIRHELVHPDALTRTWLQACHYRYRTLRVRLPYPTLGRGIQWKKLEFRDGWTQHLLPFSRRFQCYAGSQWFTVNRRAVAHILDEHRRRPRLAAHYRAGAFAPDESYLQTLLANAKHLRVSDSNQRYIVFPEDEKHPRILTTEDLPAMLASDGLFARKFDPERSAEVLDVLDQHILEGGTSGVPLDMSAASGRRAG